MGFPNPIRSFETIRNVLLSLYLVAGLMRSAEAADRVLPSDVQRMLRDAALILLKEGNARFASDHPSHPGAGADRRSVTAMEGQTPLVTVLSCADSRAPVELLFDRGVGDVFTVRVAGNVAHTDEIATIEYGVGHLHTPVLLVLGHTHCGAVTAVVKGAHLDGSLPKLVDHIQWAAARAKAEGGDEATVLDHAIRENVWQSIVDVLEDSEIVRNEVKRGNVLVLGAIYDIETGKVEWLGEHPRQKELLEMPGSGKALAEGGGRGEAGVVGTGHGGLAGSGSGPATTKVPPVKLEPAHAAH